MEVTQHLLLGKKQSPVIFSFEGLTPDFSFNCIFIFGL